VDADTELLARLVGDVQRFSREHWGRTPMRRSTGARFDDLLSVGAIERLLTMSARRPTYRLVQDGATLPPDRSSRPVRIAGQRFDDVADLARVATAVADGATLVLQALQRTWLPLATFCRSLEWATSHPVQANAYLTPAGAAGLAPHADAHDVLVLQVMGDKQWEVEGIESASLSPGDVLYVPAGVRHHASTQRAASLHITLGVLRVTRRQAIVRLLDSVAGSPLAEPLPLGFDRPEGRASLVRSLEETVAVAVDALRAADVPTWASDELRWRRGARRPLALGHLEAVVALGELDLSSTVLVHDGPSITLHTDRAPDGRIVLELADRRLLLPPATRPAIEQLLHDGGARVGALAGLSEHDQAVVASRLVREGMLRLRRTEGASFTRGSEEDDEQDHDQDDGADADVHSDLPSGLGLLLPSPNPARPNKMS